MPLAFPPFWAYSMFCFETILFRHSGFPGAVNAPPGHFVYPFGGRPNPGRFMRKPKARPFPRLRARGQMTQNLRLRMGCARSIRGEHVSSTPISFPPVRDRKTRAALYGGEKPDLFPCLRAGALCLSLSGSAKPRPLYAAAKSRSLSPACTPPGPNDSKPSASGGMCPLDKGQTRVLYRPLAFPL